jgi:hypothetical protein
VAAPGFATWWPSPAQFGPYPAQPRPTEARSRPGQRWPLTIDQVKRAHLSETQSVPTNQRVTRVAAWFFLFLFLFQKII